MSLTALTGIVRKDLRVYYSDRRAVIMGFVVPIAIASFLGSIFGGSGDRAPSRLVVAIVDDDASEVSRAILTSAEEDPALRITRLALADAREAVRRGTMTVAVVIPQGFAAAAGPALTTGSSTDRPSLAVLHDPSRAAEAGLVRGVLTRHVMDGLVRQASGGRGFELPFTLRDEPVSSGQRPHNGYAHTFAGMSIQFLLFAMIDLGVGLLLDRQRGLWRRVRSAPISRATLLLGRGISSAFVAMAILAVTFTFAGVVFGVRVHGSLTGFVLIAIAASLMASSLGLLIAAVGRSPAGSRGVASLVVLLMVMLGGAWMPSFLFPAWVQRITIAIPTRWAIDGLDAMTWRGLGFEAAVLPIVMLLGFTALFAGVTLARFRWEEVQGSP
jgi:ABC-2 type transport system permease protein